MTLRFHKLRKKRIWTLQIWNWMKFKVIIRNIIIKLFFTSDEMRFLFIKFDIKTIFLINERIYTFIVVKYLTSIASLSTNLFHSSLIASAFSSLPIAYSARYFILTNRGCKLKMLMNRLCKLKILFIQCYNMSPLKKILD